MTSSTGRIRRGLQEAGGSPVRRATLGTVFTAFMGQAMLVVSGVIAARVLGPEDRGYLALLLLVPLVVAQAGGLGVPIAVTYYIARDKTATLGIWRAIRPVLLLQAGLLTGIHCVVLWALLRDEPTYVVDAAIATVVLVPALLVQDYALAILQGAGRFLAFNVMRISYAVLYAGGLVVLVVLDVDALADVAMMWTGTVAGVSVVTLAVALTRAEHGTDAELPSVREMITFGAKGLLGSNSPLEYYRLDQAVVGLFLTPTALGIYAAALAFTGLPRFVSSAIGMVAYPHVASEDDLSEGRRKLWGFFFLTVAVCAAIVAALEVGAGLLVPFFFGEEFSDAIPVVRLLLVASLLLAARRILGDAARGLGRPGLGTLAEVASLVVLVPALVVYLPLWDVEGVAVAMVIAAAAGLLVTMVGLLVPRPERLGVAAGVAVLAIAADAAAVSVTVLVPSTATLVAAVILAALAVVAVRAALRPRTAAAEAEMAVEPASEEPVADGMSAARALYYFGLLLIGFLVVRPIGGATVSDLVFLAALGLALVTLTASGRPAPVFLGPVIVLGVALFAAGGLASSFGAEDPIESVTVVARVVYLTVVWFWLGSIVLTRIGHIQVAVACWVASAALGGAGAIAQTLWGDVIPGAEVHYGRVSGFTFNVNDFGGLCGVALIPAAMLATTARGVAARVVAIAATLLVFAGLLLSASVSGVVGALVAAAVWMAIVRPDLRLVAALAAMVVVFPAFALENNRYWESPLERFATSSQGSGSSNATLHTRIDAFEAGWETIQRSPLIGVGLAREPPETETGLAVHNVFLGSWYQAGLLAALGLVLIVAAGIVMGWRAIAAARDQRERALAASLFAALLAFVVFGQAQEVLFQRYGWVSMALLAALRAHQRSRAVAHVGSRPRREPALALPAPTG